MTVVGRVHQLWVFPVKSMRGTSLHSAEVVDAGLRGDRAWAVVDEDGTTLTAAQEPRLRQVVAGLAADGEVSLDLAGHPAGLTGHAAVDALSDWLQRQVRLEHRGDAGFVDVAPMHLVSTRSMTESEHAEECAACDIREPRANVVLDLVGDAGTEADWVGCEALVGSATLDVVRRPEHCLGVYADVRGAGVVAVGDEVVLG